MLSNKEAHKYLTKELDNAFERAKKIGHKGETRYIESLQTCLSVLDEQERLISTSPEDFGTLAICAIRYCQGRQTYMPSLVQGIIRTHIQQISDKDLSVMINDCEFQERTNMYGDENIDKPGWLTWKETLLAEKERRERG